MVMMKAIVMGGLLVTLLVACVSASPTRVTLSSPNQNCTFATNYTGWQILGLKDVSSKSTQTPASCQQACCDQSDCEVWLFSYKEHTHDYLECWIGKYATPLVPGPYLTYGRGNVPPAPPPAPPPPGPPPPPPMGPYTVDDTPGLGLRWEGVGAISGGGATTKLLMDYSPDVVSDILDFLFIPGFGLSLDILKVEMGGDTDSTEGAEPSHMHGGPGDENYNRGYEWWLMKEAKKRNPSIKLYGLPWGWPGWLDPTATPDKQAKDAFSNATTTANYTLAWLLGAKRVHGLDIDYMGHWNERDAPAAYDTALRAAVAGSELANTTTVLNRLRHYPGTQAKQVPNCHQYAWNTTDGSRWVDEEGSIYDGKSARCLARCINRGYVGACYTATFQWHLISSFYDYLPWSRCGVAVANEPWSGHYEITSPTWAIAHTTQFASPGWRYTEHDSGVTMLGQGGSLVTRVSPDMSDFSMVIEKMTTHNSACARGSNPDIEVSTEKVVLVLKGKLLAAAQSKGLHVWYSNLTSGNEEGVNPPDSQVFQKQSELLPIGSDGSVTLTVQPEEMYTITTISSGQKGSYPSQLKPATPFPLPFNQPFDDENISAPPALWYDQMGAWEVQKNPDKEGNLMRQVSPVWPACWGYSCSGPLTYFGPSTFNQSDNLIVNIDVKLEDHGTFSLYAAKNNAKGGVSFSTSDSSSIYIGGQTKTISPTFSVNTWHSIQLKYGGDSLSVSLDGNSVGDVSGSVGDGVRFVMALDRYIYASVDNFSIAKA